ncbi:MAG TPA: hypothetical protein VFN78_02570 [Ktedonobacterales bacterium]|nr:hypothetical protein [Ktedonobacterales bacterium]
MNLLTLFSRARANLALTPSERALLKLAQGLLITFVVAVCTQVSALASTGGLDLTNHNTLLLLAGAGVAAVLAALHKLSSAAGDPLLSAVVSAVESEVGKYVPLHQQSVPADASAPAPAVAGSSAAVAASDGSAI